MEKKTNFINFYNRETKNGIVVNINVKEFDNIKMSQEWDKEKQRHRIVLSLPDGREICIVPRIDKLGRMSTYTRTNSKLAVEETILS